MIKLIKKKGLNIMKKMISKKIALIFGIICGVLALLIDIGGRIYDKRRNSL